MKKPKGEKYFSHKKIKYKAVPLGWGMICDDCCFYENVDSTYCQMPKDIPCAALDRKDNTNIKWEIIK